MNLPWVSRLAYDNMVSGRERAFRAYNAKWGGV